MEPHYEEHPHAGVEVGEHEKKPVLKKVKDKVKKIKNTISKKAHGHHSDDDHNEHEHDNDVTSEEEEGYEEEREAAPEVQVYESEAARRFAGWRDENLGPGMITFGEVMATTVAVEDPSGPKNRFGTSAATDDSQLLYPSATGSGVGERRNLIRDRDENIDPQKVTLRAMAGIAEEDPSAPKDMTITPAVLATQPIHPSYSSHPSRTGGDEAGESPLLSSFQAMAVSNKPKGTECVQELPPTLTGTHDQFSLDKAQQDTPKEGTEEQKSSSYTDKISSTATAAKEATVSAAIGSTEYGKKIASTVYDKVSEAGTAIMGTGTTKGEKSGDNETGQPEKGVPDKGASVKEYVLRNLRPGDEDRALSEVISDAMHGKQQEATAVRTPKAEGPGEESGSGKGVVEKIKGAVTSWIGAGSTGTAPTTTDTDIKGEEAATGH